MFIFSYIRASFKRYLSKMSRPPTSLSQLLRRRLSREQLRWFCDDRQPTCFQVQDADDFRQRVLQSGKPVIVDFYADWCAPCRLLGPRLESIVDTRLGSLLLAKVNVDENADLAMDYDVQSLPTVIAFKDGDIIDKFIGVIEDEDLNSFITKLES
ncbi:unnamed protein product [Soboliphyme baturini]|uniref:Thioredoxin domain-containing protein n=1 Tax=Soboliphyme baturini TaxID=241478 RepID=A0A183IC41_9BILA|nr:unnamed protein product [Soboliphyme baturini]